MDIHEANATVSFIYILFTSILNIYIYLRIHCLQKSVTEQSERLSVLTNGESSIVQTDD